MRQVWSLRRRSRVLSENEIDPLLRQTLADFGSFRHVTLYVCDDLRVPAAIGFFRPAVVIPRWAFEELSAGELNAVLLHELGHLRRWDDWCCSFIRGFGGLIRGSPWSARWPAMTLFSPRLLMRGATLNAWYR
jgi:beta-lactamase regulating signal transducer with metallopeptidase domain